MPPRWSWEKTCARTDFPRYQKEPYHCLLPRPRERAPVQNQQPRGNFCTKDMKRETSAGVGAKNGDGSEIDPPNDANITNWRTGGYQDWLGEQQRLEDMRLKREFAFEIVSRNEGSKIHEAAAQLAASQLYETISDFDLRGRTVLGHYSDHIVVLFRSNQQHDPGARVMQPGPRLLSWPVQHLVDPADRLQDVDLGFRRQCRH